MKQKKIIEKERVFEFLTSFNNNLDELRGRILGKEPLPVTQEIFANSRREESRRKAMMRRKRLNHNILEHQRFGFGIKGL